MTGREETRARVHDDLDAALDGAAIAIAFSNRWLISIVEYRLSNTPENKTRTHTCSKKHGNPAEGAKFSNCTLTA